MNRRTPKVQHPATTASSQRTQPRATRGYLAKRGKQPYLPLDNRVVDRRGTTGAVVRVSHRQVAQDDEHAQPAALPEPLAPEQLPASEGERDTGLMAPPAGSAVPEPERYDIVDLPAAWRLALAANPQLGGAREALNEALALRRGANAIALPNLNAGFMYHLHNGTLQASFGQIRRLNEKSLYVGGGSRTLAAETLAIPAIQFFHHLGDVIYEPLAARQQVVVRRFDATDTANSVLLDTTLSHLDLVSAEARLDAIRQTEIEIYGIARITRSYADAGQGRNADAVRAYVEALLVHTEVQRAEERVAVASASLAQVLNLDPSVRLRTAPGPLPALQIVDPTISLEDLLAQARRRHPLLAARSAAIDIAGTRLRQEQTRPFLPLVSVGMSAGGFGGTGNFAPRTQFNQLPFTRLGNRADFDVLAVWTLQNLGIGNIATIRQRRAVRDQSIGESARALNQVRDEVAESYAQARAQLQKIKIARRQLDAAEDGYRKDLVRLENDQVEHPIEVVNLVELLSTARQDLIEAIISYNQAEFRLFVATGLSPMRAGQAVDQAPPGIDVLGPRRTPANLEPPPPPPDDELVPP